MGSKYYDIDAILTDAQKIPCTFEVDVPGLGYLDGNDNADMKAGTKLEMPIWLAEILAVSEQLGTKTFIHTNIPHALSAPVMNALKANPLSVNLRDLATHYYSLGERMVNLVEDAEDELVDTLSETFRRRTIEIADHAVNPKGALGEGTEFLMGLEESERQIFRAAHDSTKAMKSWRQEKK
ncbi:DNA replication protein [Orbilia blumenaviensis]|uniref:DNA replication complex GINS protein PSF3 n=1 Tax=Orbilia blumenaviensis TaxID=1796055 RepID=A0AAV9VLI8_9PEZI